MKAKVKPINLPTTKLPPTKAVRVDVPPTVACFAERIEREKHREHDVKMKSGILGFTPRTRYMKWTDEQDAELVRLYDEGKTIPDIANHFGATYDSVQSRLKKLQAAGQCGHHKPTRKEDKEDEAR